MPSRTANSRARWFLRTTFTGTRSRFNVQAEDTSIYPRFGRQNAISLGSGETGRQAMHHPTPRQEPSVLVDPADNVHVRPFELTLERTCVYRRVQSNATDMSFTSSMVRPQAWDALSRLSLREVSSMVSVIRLPISVEDIDSIAPGLTFAKILAEHQADSTLSATEVWRELTIRSAEKESQQRTLLYRAVDLPFFDLSDSDEHGDLSSALPDPPSTSPILINPSSSGSKPTLIDQSELYSADAAIELARLSPD